MTQLVTECLNRYEPVALLKDIDLTYEPSRRVYLKTDSKQLARALDNIMTNCLKYATNMIEVEIIQKDQEVTLRFQDDGSGFEQKKIDGFGQSINKDTAESGIGTTSIQNIVDLLGGDMSIGNGVKGGAFYSIRLH